MAVDHKRPLPVPRERLDALTDMHTAHSNFDHLGWQERREILQLALSERLVEEQERISFFLGEAYEIYNARFR